MIKKNVVLLCVVAFAGMALGVVIGGRLTGPRGDEAHVGIMNPLPKSMNELVASADLIVVGTIGPVAKQGTFYGYDEDAPHLAKFDREGQTSSGLPFVDYEVQIERVLVEDDSLASSSPVILREIGDLTIQHKLPMPAMPKSGDRRLLFLSRNPDGETYGAKTLMHEIDISTPVAVYYTGLSAQIPFGVKIRSEDFVDRIEHAIRQISTTSER